MAARELARLTQSYLTDGARGLNSKRTHDPSLPQRLHSLFFAPAESAAEAGCGGGRRLVPVHADPPMYVVPHFLSPRELDHFDDLITSRRTAFKNSHTDGDAGALVSEERTSISLALPKSGDAVLRAIEARAAELVGLPSDHVEPMQVVHYSHGAKFDMHHDLAPIEVRTDDGEGGTDGNSVEGGSGEHGEGFRRSPRAHKGADADTDELARLETRHVTVEAEDGPRRLVTLFVYLNTLPEGVGHTEFPLLRSASGKPFSVRPRSGTALIFCNVDASGRPDVRLCHRACPVDDGHVKFGVNIWVSDVSQQAHVLAVPSAGGRKPGARGGKGLLAPLLFREADDLPPPPPAAIVGIEVRRKFGRLGTWTGTVASHCPTNGYHIVYADGDEEDMAAEDLFRLPLVSPHSLVGRRVSKYFAGHGRFDGEVDEYDETQGFGVTYVDGDREHLHPDELLRLLQPMVKSKAVRKKRARESSSSE